MKKFLLWLAIVTLYFSIPVFSQNSASELMFSYDSSITKMRKNIIRYNVTPQILWGSNNFVLGYERRLSDFESVSLNVGFLTFPKLAQLAIADSLIARDHQNTGFSVAADYRRYFKKRNRGFAPDGLYWGPYIAYYRYNFKNRLNFIDSLGNQVTGSYAEFQGSANIINVGVELGYQFVIKKRIAVDLIMVGPGYGFYGGKLKLDSNVEISDEDEILSEIRDRLVNKFPVLDGLLEGQEVETSGDYGTWTGGLRFVIQVGYVF
ncbi:DUF3575 domain-containing protein [Flammeovirga yaeyamensis]|uniref:DUF3575 domain-containing protein n=1 Tax=Flammeovirga yaeyamensis TaxID=367791 RepID=A0AAX1NCH0_9BACT|nr:DUF3575 domain-containing protein [Flammeovirga yaeyamensis]MBB3698880.1 hypothetical protein [Flammeovirga yaeyamensis]NMF37464.1 DUF3575 domain-containing protein [Flammeovirga yaeyamensis]QWG03723.1 DUF3575 domain-containing protein [Flammeovirga yaeyamensis]